MAEQTSGYALKSFRGPNDPVFISLKRPYNAISNDTVSEILRKSIKDAGLAGLGHTPRSFRPTGATAGAKPVRLVFTWYRETAGAMEE
jgi:hypothetical protein